MADTELTLNQVLRDALTPGPVADDDHTEVEELVEYHQGRLPMERVDAVEEHFVTCRRCAELSADLAFFSRPLDELRELLGESPAAVLVSSSRGPGPWAPARWFRSPALLPTLVAALVLIVVGLATAWLGARRGTARLASELAQLTSELELPSKGETNLPIATVASEALLRRQGSHTEEPPTPVPAGAVLILTPGGDATYDLYNVEILANDGSRVWSGSGMRLSSAGSFHLRLPKALVPGTGYRIRIWNPEEPTLAAESFAISIATPSEPIRESPAQ